MLDDGYPHPTSEAVTAVMKGNRRADTKPELVIRSALHRLGLRFRKDHLIREDGVRVKADVVFTRQRVVVFVDGCFWHGCPEHGHTPKANSHYWRPKLQRNVERDRRNNAALEAAGWQVIRIWEHEPPEEAVKAVVGALRRGLGETDSSAARLLAS